MDVVKITNVMWLPKLATRIAEFARKIDHKTVLPENLYAYFNQIVQFGGSGAEFWCVVKKAEPQAFASWAIRGLPHTGCTCMDFIYNWSKKRDAVRLLVDEWIEFGKKNRCRYYDGISINDQTNSIFQKYAEELDMHFEESGLKGFTCWKK